MEALLIDTSFIFHFDAETKNILLQNIDLSSDVLQNFLELAGKT